LQQQRSTNLPSQKNQLLFAFDLADADAAREMAQRMADKTGRDVVVTDDEGCEVCTVKPIRRNEIIVRPKI
jgi:hypothetical protein